MGKGGWGNLSLLTRGLAGRIGVISAAGLLVLALSLGVWTACVVRAEMERQALERQNTSMAVAHFVLSQEGGDVRIENGRLYAGTNPIQDTDGVVDRVQKLVGGVATIFVGDERVSTNVRLPDGSRAIGTKLAMGPVHDAIFVEKRSYRGEAEILGEPFYTAYDPLFDRNGAVAGILFVGLKQLDFQVAVDSVIHHILVLAGMVALLGGVAIWWVTRRSFAVLDEVREIMLGIADNGSHDIPTTIPGTLRHDEIGEMARAVEVFAANARERDQLVRQAILANRAKTEFLANMSHELRTPLNAIMGFSDAMLQEIFGPVGHAKYQEYASGILISGRHLLDLINDILDVAKIESGKMELHEDVFNPAQVVEACRQLIQERADEAGVLLVAATAANLPSVQADERRIKQVLLNLLSNAVKFTPAGGTVTVKAEAAANGGVAMIVADTGIGIAASDIPIVLTPFGQVDSRLSRKYDGCGLGLPLSKAFIELHGGRLSIDTQPGRGTTIVATLPPWRVAPARIGDSEPASPQRMS